MKIAIIGAGIAGLTLAQELQHHASVTVFEKSRGVGGRMATRYADPFFFDHGTQFFTARTSAFQAFVESLVVTGVIAPWDGKVITLKANQKPEKRLWFEPHYVATPNMNSLCKHLANNINVVMNTEIAPLTHREPAGFTLMSKSGESLGVFDWVISTAPPPQTQTLFRAPIAEVFTDNPPQVKLQGCYTLMLGWHKPWDKSWIAAKLHDPMLQWLAVNSSKPHRNAATTCLVVHSTHEWAEAHIDCDVPAAQAILLAGLDHILTSTGVAVNLSSPDYLTTHRWRYADAVIDKPQPPFLDTALHLASVGDWCTASRIEAVWTDAMLLAKQVRGQIT